MLDLTSLAQTSEPGQVEAKRLSMLTTAFELVATASIQEVRRGCRLDTPEHSILHGPTAQDERKRRWDAIKSYFQHPGIHRRRNDGKDRHWFRALDDLLEYRRRANNENSRPTANPAIITRDELSELVDACMAGGVLKEANIPSCYPDLKDFLRSASTSRRGVV